LPVNQRDPDRSTGEGSRGLQAGEATADDDHAWLVLGAGARAPRRGGAVVHVAILNGAPRWLPMTASGAPGASWTCTHRVRGLTMVLLLRASRVGLQSPPATTTPEHDPQDV
jgi:hypothetical protein